MAALTILRDAALKRLPAELTGWWVAIVDERKWRRDTGEALVRARLFQLPDLDAHLAKVSNFSPPRSFPLCLLTLPDHKHAPVLLRLSSPAQPEHALLHIACYLSSRYRIRGDWIAPRLR